MNAVHPDFAPFLDAIAPPQSTAVERGPAFTILQFADRWTRIRWRDGREEKVSDERLFRIRRSADYAIDLERKA